MEGDAYQANFTNRFINQKVATLYARNPRVEAQRRKHLDFALWDGKVESILQAGAQLNAAMQLAQHVGPAAMQLVPPGAQALMFTSSKGWNAERLLTRLAKTLEILFQYQMDSQQPDFKVQMKQLVRRTCVCGVGFIKVSFVRDYETEPTQSETRSCTQDRVKRAREIIEKLEKQKIDEDDPEIETLQTVCG